MSTTGGARRFSPAERSGRPQPSHDGARTTAPIQGSSLEVNHPLNCRLLTPSETPRGADDEQLASDWQSYNAVFGVTNNPWDVSRTPGGSSGGEAAALAAGLTYVSVGSDIGGSIRIPAHFCGVYGHKPTLGVVPLQGHIPPPPGGPPGPPSSLAVGGPLARSAADLTLALR